MLQDLMCVQKSHFMYCSNWQAIGDEFESKIGVFEVDESGAMIMIQLRKYVKCCGELKRIRSWSKTLKESSKSVPFFMLFFAIDTILFLTKLIRKAQF